MNGARAGGPLRAILVGFGAVGRALAEVLVRRSDYPGLRHFEVSTVAITTGSRGALANPAGIDLASALAERLAQGRFTSAHPDFSPLDSAEALRRLDYDVAVELSPLDVARRGEPAISHVRAALERGRHVVTANKGPLAWAYRPLRELAERNGAAFLHEATVMDGAPVFNLARHGLQGARIERIEGILNSTTNYVLGAVEGGSSVAAAVEDARRAGFAEADPRLDLDGWDAAVKVSALANVLMDADLPPEAVAREPLDAVDPSRVRAARARGCRIKMVAECFREPGDGVVGRVLSRELPLAHPFALVQGTSSILSLTTDLLGTITLTEQSPDLRATAFGVLSDLISLSR